jgi:hypothetical protein
MRAYSLSAVRGRENQRRGREQVRGISNRGAREEGRLNREEEVHMITGLKEKEAKELRNSSRAAHRYSGAPVQKCDPAPDPDDRPPPKLLPLLLLLWELWL